MNSNEILRIYGTDYKGMTIKLLGEAGLEDELKSKAAALGYRDAASLKIAIKPNLVSPTPAEYGATTHTEIVAGIIEFLKERGYNQLTIMEGSWVGDKTADAFEYCGYNDLSRKYGVRIIDTQKEKTEKTDCAGMNIGICRCVKEVDFLINVPVLKGHCQTKMTCALKNMKGLISNGEKRHFHIIGLHKPIAHLNAGIHQDFIVIDHICGDPDFEDGGNPLVRNCIMVAKDPVLTDAYACTVLGYEIDQVKYVRLAEQLGIGSADLEKMEMITIEGTGLEVVPETRKILEVDYAVEEVDSCSACYGMLVGALYRLKEEGLLEKLDAKLSETGDKVCIGQGWRGKCRKCGIGDCTKDFEWSVPGCPPEEDEIYEALRKYI